MHEPYNRRLPHIMPPGETLFITFRLYGTMPHDILRSIQQEHSLRIQKLITEENSEESVKKRLEGRYFVSVDQYMDRSTHGGNWLRNDQIAQVVKESLHFGHAMWYNLHAFCIMPNHVHLLLTVLEDALPFFTILQRLKRHSAVRANRILNRTGQPFWQPESYDHIVRNKKSFERIVSYILLNPAKAGLVENWENWPHTYCQYE
ncbi:transposase [Spirosoma flavus]